VSRDDLLHVLYGAVGEDAGWVEVLKVFASYFDANISMLVVAGQGQRDKSFYAAYNHREESARAYSDYWWERDVMLQAVFDQGIFIRGMVGRGSDILDPKILRASPYYQEFMRHMPAEHFLGCILSDGSDAALAPPMHFSLFRPPEAEDFSDDEVTELVSLYPHLHRAFELHWQQRSTQEQLQVFHQSLDGLDFGVLFIDPAGNRRHANAAAQAMIGHSDWSPLLGELKGRVGATSKLGELLQSCALGHGGALSLGPEHQRVFVLALPLAAPVVTAAGDRRASVMLMLIDPQQRPEAALDFVVRVFGLSKAEARLLPLLFENRTPADMAQALDIKISTVRSHLSAIFAKTGTTRQQELIRLLGALPPIQRVVR
jgi:DNA-binding CsgD family transcriptional regulator/PAS domain-containing protein